jgi:hypothetical protein
MTEADPDEDRAELEERPTPPDRPTEEDDPALTAEDTNPEAEPSTKSGAFLEKIFFMSSEALSRCWVRLQAPQSSPKVAAQRISPLSFHS